MLTPRLTTPHPRMQAALESALALAIMLTAWWAVVRWDRERLLTNERARVEAQVESIATALTMAMERRFTSLDGLVALVLSDPAEASLSARFDAFASALYPTARGVRSFRIYIGGIDQLVYPLADNESAIGLDIFDHQQPLVRDAVQRAVQTRQAKLIGPFELGKGAAGMMATRPIFLGDNFWGFATIIMELSPILQDAGIGVDAVSHPHGLSLMLKDSEGQIFYGPPEVNNEGPVTDTLYLPDGTWELLGIPEGGWDQAVGGPLFLVQAAGLVIVGLLTALTYLTSSRQGRLAVAVQERTSEIQAINTTLERQAALIELAHDAILVRELDGVISFWNLGAERLYGWSRAEVLGTVSHSLLRTQFPESRAAVDRSLLEHGRWDGELLHTGSSGEQIYVASRQVLQRDKSDRPLVMEINIDITKQKRAEGVLERRVEERTRELAALLDLSGAVSFTLELGPLLGLVLDRLESIINYTAAVITVEEDGELVILEYQGPLPRERLVGIRLPEQSPSAKFRREILQRRGPVLVEDLGGQPPLARYLESQGVPISELADGHARAQLGVPLLVQGRTIGTLSLVHRTPGYYTARHAELAMAFAQQVAIAIENARLYEASLERAALEERHRLARELHDSVSQVLYSIGLIASSAELVRERDPEQLPTLHREVRNLAEGGLAEMRALIFELRPESLEQEGLVAALEKQAAAVQARHGIAVRADLCDEPDLPLATKEGLYRIAQEALQNAVKHARPGGIELVLTITSAELQLRVADNGAGFQPDGAFPGHLGLHTMRERADRMGAELEVDSSPGRGTRVRVRLPLPD